MVFILSLAVRVGSGILAVLGGLDMALELWISVDLSMLDKRNSFGLLHCYMKTSQIIKVTSSPPLHNVGLYALQFLKIAVSWSSCLGSNCRTLVEHQCC